MLSLHHSPYVCPPAGVVYSAGDASLAQYDREFLLVTGTRKCRPLHCIRIAIFSAFLLCSYSNIIVIAAPYLVILVRSSRTPGTRFPVLSITSPQHCCDKFQ